MVILRKAKERARGLSLKHLIRIDSCSLFHFIIILSLSAATSSGSSVCVSSVKDSVSFSLLLFYIKILFFPLPLSSLD